MKVNIKEGIAEVRRMVEENLVSIADIAEGYGKWQPDLRVDPRLREKLVKLVELCRADPDFGPGFMLPVSSCYRPFNPQGYAYERKDARDPRGHWATLAADIGYQNVLPQWLWSRFVKYARQAGLRTIHKRKYGEWWHFSRSGKYVPNGLSKWRPADDVAKLRGKVCRALGLL